LSHDNDGAKSVKNLETLERFSKLATGREKRMISVREEINNLLVNKRSDLPLIFYEE